jgi:hypothetical protein
MRSLVKVSCMIGVVAAVFGVTAADASSRDFGRSPYGYAGSYDAYAPSYDAYDAYDSVGGAGPRTSIPNDAGGPAYLGGERGINSSSDFQLQGR